jgi:hypothetical protein
VAEGGEGLLVVTTLGIEGSPLVRLDTGDVVRRLPACRCGDPRPAILVLGRATEVVTLAGRKFHAQALLDAAATAADVLDSAVFFVVVLRDRLLVRVEVQGPASGEPLAALHAALGDVPVELETVAPGDLVDVELLGRSPHVYKPVVLVTGPGQGGASSPSGEGMIEWPRPSAAEGGAGSGALAGPHAAGGASPGARSGGAPGDTVI